MITLPPALDALWRQSLTSSKKAICIKITRTDGVIFRLTTASYNVTFEGEEFETMGGGVVLSNIRKEVGMKGHSSNAAGYVSSDDITAEDILAGRFNRASVEHNVINPKYPWVGGFKISEYRLGAIEFTDQIWSAEIISLASLLQKKTGHTLEISCENDLGDTACAVNLSLWTITPVTVSGSLSRYSFDAIDVDIGSTLNRQTIDDGFFELGKILWLTGNNAGVSSRISSYFHTDRVFTLFRSTPFTIQSGDTFTLTRGCNKLFDEEGVGDCVNIYDNAENFIGQPWIPGADKAFQTPPLS